MLAVFPKGSCSLSNTNGGFSFYSPGPENVDLTTAKEVTFGYSVMFEEGFQFNMGGKLPGLCEYSFCLFVIGTHKAQDGGDNEEVAAACSGGRHDEGGWPVRLMWRTGGAGEMYTYLPRSFSANLAQCRVPPFSTPNST